MRTTPRKDRFEPMETGFHMPNWENTDEHQNEKPGSAFKILSRTKSPIRIKHCNAQGSTKPLQSHLYESNTAMLRDQQNPYKVTYTNQTLQCSGINKTPTKSPIRIKHCNAQGSTKPLQRTYSIESMDSKTDCIVASLNLEEVSNNYNT